MGADILIAVVVAAIVTFFVEYVRMSNRMKVFNRRTLVVFAAAMVVIVGGLIITAMVSKKNDTASSSNSKSVKEMQEIVSTASTGIGSTDQIAEKSVGDTPSMEKVVPENNSGTDGGKTQGKLVENAVSPEMNGDLLQDEVTVFVHGWLKAWEGAAGEKGNMENFSSYYAENFTGSAQKRAAWVEDKTRKNKRKKWIKVSVDQIKVGTLNPDKTLEVNFEQSYASSNYSQKSRKTIIIRKDNGEWKIVDVK